MEEKWIEVFKAGAWTDSAGRTRTWTQEDIERIYQASVDKDFPAVIGHPKDNSPAWGWKGGIKKEVGSIWVRFKDLVPEFVEMVNKKMFPNRSVALNPDYSIRHVGFLGAVAPAVKGLAPIALAAEEPLAVIEFSDHADRIRAVGGIFGRLREWIIEKFGAEAADKAVPGFEIDYLKTAMPEEESKPSTYSHPSQGEKEEAMTITEEELSQKLREQEAQFSAKIASIEEARKKKEEELAKKEAEIAAKEADLKRKEISNFCEGLKREGKFLPAWEKMGIVAFMESLDAQPTEIEFSEGKKETPGAFFRRFLSEMPKRVEFEEIATTDKEIGGAAGTGQEFSDSGKTQVDPDRLALHNKAVAYQRQHKVSYVDAVKAVSR